jgi:putative ABC transport system permease protein
MLVAHQAVSQKIQSVKSSIGNTITIAPAGFSSFSSVNNSLTTAQLSPILQLANITNLTETLTDRLTTIGASTPTFGFGGQSSSTSNNGQTSLTSPVTFNSTRVGGGGAGRFFFSGGEGGSGATIPTNFSLPITIIGTTDPTNVNGTALTLSSGKMISGSSTAAEALISSSMASKNNLSVGSTFSAYGTNLTIAGIFSSPSSDQTLANNVVVSLPVEQSLSGQSGDVTAAVATVNSLDNLNSATTAIKNKLGSAADVTSAEQQANNTVAPLNSVKNISLFSLIGAVIAGAVIILLTMIMIVRERRREIGVLKAIGASNIRIMFQFMTEAVTFALIGAAIGLLIGVVGGNPVTRLLVNNSTSSSTSTTGIPPGPAAPSAGTTITTVRGGGGFFRNIGGRTLTNSFSHIHSAIGFSIILYGLAAAIIIAVVGSSIASFFIAKIRPAEVMRVE